MKSMFIVILLLFMSIFHDLSNSMIYAQDANDAQKIEAKCDNSCSDSPDIIGNCNSSEIIINAITREEKITEDSSSD